MIFDLTSDEIIQRGKLVRELRSPSVASLYGVFKDRSKPADLLGSGTFVQHRDDIFVLTARHVLNDYKKYDYVFHDIGGDGELMYPFKGNWIGWSECKGDLALWGCFGELFDSSKIHPMPLIEPFGSTNEHEDAVFLTSGYPDEKALSLPFAGEYRTALHTAMGKAATLGSNPDHSFSFYCANDIKYFGMSGSGVWNLNLHKCESIADWSPELSTFSGVLIQWVQNGHLIATKAEVVKKFLSGSIEQLRSQWN